jgi:hypothetical protein
MKKEWSFFYVFFVAGFCPIVFHRLLTALCMFTATLRTNVTSSGTKPVQPFLSHRHILIIALPAGVAEAGFQPYFPALLQNGNHV